MLLHIQVKVGAVWGEKAMVLGVRVVDVEVLGSGAVLGAVGQVCRQLFLMVHCRSMAIRGLPMLTSVVQSPSSSTALKEYCRHPVNPSRFYRDEGVE